MRAALNHIILNKHEQMILATSDLYSLTETMEMYMLISPVSKAAFLSLANYVYSEVITNKKEKKRCRKNMLAALYEIYEHMKIFRNADLAREEVIQKISEIAVELIEFAEEKK